MKHETSIRVIRHEQQASCSCGWVGPMRSVDNSVAKLDSAAHVDDSYDDELCDACQGRPRGHGHWAMFCEPCSELPYGAVAP